MTAPTISYQTLTPFLIAIMSDEYANSQNEDVFNNIVAEARQCALQGKLFERQLRNIGTKMYKVVLDKVDIGEV